MLLHGIYTLYFRVHAWPMTIDFRTSLVSGQKVAISAYVFPPFMLDQQLLAFARWQ